MELKVLVKSCAAGKIIQTILVSHVNYTTKVFNLLLWTSLDFHLSNLNEKKRCKV